MAFWQPGRMTPFLQQSYFSLATISNGNDSVKMWFIPVAEGIKGL